VSIADKVIARTEPVAVSPAPLVIQHGTLSREQGRESPAPGPATRAVQGAGMPLPQPQRTYFEPRFGTDFSRVRVHADGLAAEGAREVRARAYTVGPHIVFGAGQYAPGTTQGRRLLAHELAHVVQQRNGAVHDTVLRAPDDSALGKLPAAERQTLQVDTDAVQGNYRDLFGLKGDLVLATNVDADYDFQAPSIDALKDDKVKAGLWKGLRAYSMGLFDLVPGEDGKARSKRLRLVHIENLDLTKWGGPNTSFRFTSRGQTSAKGGITVQILVEALDLPAKPLADPAALKSIEATATRYGLTHDPVFPESLWQRILGALGKIPESLLMRIRDVRFDSSAAEQGSKKEAAEFKSVYENGAWTKRIVLYQKMVRSKDQDFALTLAHEIGHAIDEAPAEGAKGMAADVAAHNDAQFKEAAKKDGGRVKAITEYAKTDDSEFFAECFALFIQQPAALKALRPNIYGYFDTYQYGALKDPKLNPYYKAPGAQTGSTGAGIVGSF
jgi:Mlc titration factor MtfA (ptsG expression regulator)